MKIRGSIPDAINACEKTGSRVTRVVRSNRRPRFVSDDRDQIDRLAGLK